MSGADSGAIFDAWVAVIGLGAVAMYLLVLLLAWWAFR